MSEGLTVPLGWGLAKHFSFPPPMRSYIHITFCDTLLSISKISQSLSSLLWLFTEQLFRAAQKQCRGPALLATSPLSRRSTSCSPTRTRHTYARDRVCNLLLAPIASLDPLAPLLLSSFPLLLLLAKLCHTMLMSTKTESSYPTL